MGYTPFVGGVTPVAPFSLKIISFDICCYYFSSYSRLQPIVVGQSDSLEQGCHFPEHTCKTLLLSESVFQEVMSSFTLALVLRTARLHFDRAFRWCWIGSRDRRVLAVSGVELSRAQDVELFAGG